MSVKEKKILWHWPTEENHKITLKDISEEEFDEAFKDMPNEKWEEIMGEEAEGCSTNYIIIPTEK
jgi:hypothetical protein